MSLHVSVHPHHAHSMRLVEHEAQDDAPPFVVIKLGQAVGTVSLLFHDLADLSAFAELVSRAQDALVDLQVEAERKEHEEALF